MYHVASIGSKIERTPNAPILKKESERLLRLRAVVTLLGFPAHFAYGLDDCPESIVSPMLVRLRALSMGDDLTTAVSDSINYHRKGRPRKPRTS